MVGRGVRDRIGAKLGDEVLYSRDKALQRTGKVQDRQRTRYLMDWHSWCCKHGR